MMMEAVRTSETSVDNHFTRQYNPEDSSEQQKRDYIRILDIVRVVCEISDYHGSQYEEENVLVYCVV
jgi:hypothetical protein